MGKRPVSARIVKNLASPDAGKRRSAVEALSFGDVRAVYPLIKALRDSHPGVQDAAMRSLISIGGEVAAWMVLPLLREDPFLRNAAMVILKEQVSSNMEGIANVTRANEASVDQIRVTVLDLSRMAGELNNSAAWFRV